MADHPSHRFAGDDDRCVYCDARAGGFAARYECDSGPLDESDLDGPRFRNTPPIQS